jgi:hypothetical protein
MGRLARRQLRIVRMFDASRLENKNRSIISSSNHRRARTVVAPGSPEAIVSKDAMSDIVTKTAYFALATGVVVFVAMFLLTLTHS